MGRTGLSGGLNAGNTKLEVRSGSQEDEKHQGGRALGRPGERGDDQRTKCHRQAKGDKCSLSSARWMKAAFLISDNELVDHPGSQQIMGPKNSALTSPPGGSILLPEQEA